MGRRAKLCVAMFCTILFLNSAAADDPSSDRYDFKSILKNVASDVSKNFYDPKLKGVDWKAATEEAKKKIETAGTINEMEVIIYQLLEKLDDSHTYFIPPMSAVEAKYGFDAKPYGNQVFVYEVEHGGAAEAAGLQVGDRIRQINSYEAERQTLEKLLIYSRKLYQVPSLNLVVQHPSGVVSEISIIPKLKRRAKVVNRYANFNQIWALALDDYDSWQKKYGTYHSGTQADVGYFQIREFSDEGEDFLKGVAEKTRGSKAVIVDLRDSPGGSVKTLLILAGLFQTDESDMANQVGRTKTEPLKIKPQRPYIDAPLFILVDSTTASASEMLTRHLQKTRNAIVIGDKTAGAVTIAKTVDGSIGGGYITEYSTSVGIGRVVFADGEELEKKGITPDVTCLPTQADLQDGKDPCLDKAFGLAKERIKVGKATPSSAN